MSDENVRARMEFISADKKCRTHENNNSQKIIKFTKLYLVSYDLSKEELLNGFEENKTPGEDGFTEEYYEAFFDLIDRFH